LREAIVGARDVVEDAELSEHDCLVETELGIANFGLDTQLKEVEQGFFDLLALKAGESVNRSLLAPYTALSGGRIDAALEGPHQPGDRQPD
jgi:hypothetical protein